MSEVMGSEAPFYWWDTLFEPERTKRIGSYAEGFIKINQDKFERNLSCFIFEWLCNILSADNLVCKITLQ